MASLQELKLACVALSSSQWCLPKQEAHLRRVHSRSCFRRCGAGQVCNGVSQDNCCCEAWLQHLGHDSHALGSVNVIPTSSASYIEHEHQRSMYDAEDVGMTSALLSA